MSILRSKISYLSPQLSYLSTQKIFPLSEYSATTQNNCTSSPTSPMSISYIASLLESPEPPPVCHFFLKISLSFSCFLLRILYTIVRKSNKNLKSDFLSLFPFLMDRQAIYEYLTKIPYGKVTTYKHIAQKFWIHPRVVGMIMRSNDHPDKYPCCKVVWADGKLTGYALGLEEKIRRLATEGIPVQNNRVPLEYLWTWVEEKKIRF